MAKKSGEYGGYSDAAYMRPRLIDDYELLARDDSGGPDFTPYTAQFGDGGHVTGAKAHLSVSGGKDDPLDGDEQDSTAKARMKDKGDGAPASSKRMARK